ncbi:MAG: nucleotidyltransferase family protein [Paracoccaceae bacterium]
MSSEPTGGAADGQVAILLFAAGASKRMGGADKLLQEIDGVPILRRQAQAAIASGAPVIALLPVDRPARHGALAGLALQKVSVADAALGMSASFRAGIKALPKGAEAAIMMLADMPEIETADIARLIAAWRDAPLRPARLCGPADQPGSPVLFPARFFEALARIEGDEGGRSVLRGQEITRVPCPDARALIDLDTPEDWAAWRAKNPRR